MSLLEVSVAAGDSGPVVTLLGEADLSTVAELSAALTAQVSGGAQHLTVDISRLRFADSAAIRALVLADRTLKDRGGALELVRPQPAVARALSLLGVDQALTVRAATGTDTGPQSTLAELTGAGPGPRTPAPRGLGCQERAARPAGLEKNSRPGCSRWR